MEDVIRAKTTRWRWGFFTLKDDVAICSICNKNFSITFLSNANQHLKTKHSLSLKLKKGRITEDEKWNALSEYFDLENGYLKCKYQACNKLITGRYTKLFNHLDSEHMVNPDMVKKLEQWVRPLFNFEKSNRNNCECYLCGMEIRNFNTYILVTHMTEIHNTTTIRLETMAQK